MSSFVNRSPLWKLFLNCLPINLFKYFGCPPNPGLIDLKFSSVIVSPLSEFLTTYKDLENSDENDKEILREFLKNALYDNQFSKVKDVIYDNNTQIISSIPGLIKVENNYVIQNSKRISTSRNLPKKSFTKKNKNILDK